MHRLATPAISTFACVLLTSCGLFFSPTDKGENLMAAGLYSEAIQALRSTPRSAQRERLLARAFRIRAAKNLKRGDCKTAISDLEAAAQLEARVKVDYQQVDRCFAKAKRPPPLPVARFLYQSGDTRTRILNVLLTQAISAQNFTEANQLARSLAARNIWKLQHAQWLARMSIQQSTLSDARFWLLKLVSNEPENAYLLTRLAITCSQLNDNELAHLYFGRAWAVSPGNAVLAREWHTVCTRRKDHRCLEMLNAHTDATNDDRKLRPLLKSKR